MWNIILYKERQFEVERLHPCSCLDVLCMNSNGLCNEGVGSTILLFLSIAFVFLLVIDYVMKEWVPQYFSF